MRDRPGNQQWVVPFLPYTTSSMGIDMHFTLMVIDTTKTHGHDGPNSYFYPPDSIVQKKTIDINKDVVMDSSGNVKELK